MDYKKKIITLLDKVKTEQTFKQVYKLLEYLYLREAHWTHILMNGRSPGEERSRTAALK